MKKLFLLSLAVMGFAFSTNAQSIADNAIGLRLGDSNGVGAEISYQRALADNNRLEANLGWRDGKTFDSFQLTGLYQWVMPLDGSFNWYVGAGGGLASYDSDNGDSGTSIFAAGDIGIEYDFEIPLLISLDFKPVLDFGSYRKDDLNFDIALGIRYQF